VVVLPEGDLAGGAGSALEQLLHERQLIRAPELRSIVDELVQRVRQHVGNDWARRGMDEFGG